MVNTSSSSIVRCVGVRRSPVTRADNNDRKVAIVIFLLALFLRVVALGMTFHGNESVVPFDDAKIALNLIDGRGYSIDFNYRNWLFYGVFLKQEKLVEPIMEGVKPTASKQPAYPIFLWILFRFFGARNYLAVFLVHAVLSALTAVILFLALKHHARPIAVIAAVGVACYPPFVFHSITTPESTTLLLCLVALLLLALMESGQRGSVKSWIAIGVLGGVIILTEPVMSLFVALCLGYRAHLGVLRGEQGVVKRLVLGFVIIALLLSPWLVRNYVVFGRFPVK